MEKLWNNRKARMILLLMLTLLYFAGIIALFFNTGLGIVLWGAALLPSLVLYMWLEHRKRLEKERKAEEEAQKNAEE